MRRADDVWLDGPAILTFSTLRAPEAIRRMLGHVGKDVATLITTSCIRPIA